MCMSNYVRFRNLNNEARAELLYQLKSMLYDVFLGTAVFGLLEILVLFWGLAKKNLKCLPSSSAISVRYFIVLGRDRRCLNSSKWILG